MLDQPDAVLIDAAADAGFDGVGLRLSLGRSDVEIETSRSHAARRGLMIHDAEVYRIAEDAPDPGLLIEQTVAVGATALLVVSDLTDRTATVRALTALTERCRQHGVGVGLEYMAWTNPSAPLDAIDIADEAGCELLVDVLHHVRVGAGIEELDAIVESGRLGWVQLCDAPLANPAGSALDSLIHEARHGRVPPGHGELPLGELLARLPSDVAISVEVQSDTLLAIQPLARARLLHDASRSVLAG
jgi:sugar phosphate isomerase/epimerase